MKPTLSTRKPIGQLRPSDIATFPVWEFATDEEGSADQDETWVKPLKTKIVPADAFSLSVAAKFKSASGMEFRGIVGVTTSGGLEVVHGAILTENAYVFIPWPEFVFAKRSCQAASQALGMSESALFPLQYEVLVPIQGVRGPVQGTYAYSDA